MRKSEHGIELDDPTLSDLLTLGDCPPDDLEHWDTDDDMQAADRLAGSIPTSGRSPYGVIQPPSAMMDAPHPAVSGWHATLNQQAAQASLPAGERNAKRRRRSLFAGAVLWLGLAVFICGGGLFGTSIANGRGDLWSVGMPLALVGLVALLIGLVMQVEGLWHSGREILDSADRTDQRLSDIERTIATLDTSHDNPSQALPNHSIAGANPQQLFADLKGHLDLLATQMGNHVR